MQRGCKRARGESNIISVGAVQAAASAALARARLKKNELWRLYSLQKMGGLMGMEESVFLEELIWPHVSS